MDCTQFSNSLDALLDGVLSGKDAQAMQTHMETCPRCRALYGLSMDLRAMGREDAEQAVTPPLLDGWRQAVREETQPMKTPFKRKLASWLAAAAALVFVIGGGAFSRNRMREAAENDHAYTAQSSADWDATYDEGADYTTLAAAGAVTNFAYEDGAQSSKRAAAVTSQTAPLGATADTRESKIRRSASMDLKTAAFDDTLSVLLNQTAQFGGRVESQTVSGREGARTAYLTLRVPQTQLDGFLSGAKSAATVERFSESSDDLTDTYYDTQARLETQQAKLSRLTALMEKAETVADLVEIENSIADTQYLIDSYTASLKNYDSLVDESTVNVTLSEVTPREAAPEKGFFEKAWLGLEGSLSDGWQFLQEAGLFLVAALPYLAIAAAVFFIVRAIVRSRRARKER